jgi:hypothetical protein
VKVQLQGKEKQVKRNQRYDLAKREVFWNRLFINSLCGLSAGAIVFCLSGLLSGETTKSIRLLFSALSGLSVGGIVSVVASSPIEDAIAAFTESGKLFYDDYRKQAVISGNDSESAIQVHKEGMQLLKDLESLSLVLQKNVHDFEASEKSEETIIDGFIPVLSGNIDNSSSSSFDMQRQLPPSDQGSKTIDFSRWVERKNKSNNQDLQESNQENMSQETQKIGDCDRIAATDSGDMDILSGGERDALSSDSSLSNPPDSPEPTYSPLGIWGGI